MKKKVPVWLLLLFVWLALVGGLIFGWDVWRIKTSHLGMQTKTDRLVIGLASSPALLKQSIKEINQGSLLISPDFYPELKGFKSEKGFVDSGYLLLATFDARRNQSAARLVRLSDQKVLHQWTPDYNAIIKAVGGQNKDWDHTEVRNLRLYNPLLLPDGSLVFSTLLSPLIKIDSQSKLVWTVNGIFHHAIIPDADGNLWVPSVIKPSPFLPGILNKFKDDALTEISPEGKVLYQRSVAQILADNGYKTLLLGMGAYERDLLHVNRIEPALNGSKYWMKGDLLVSVRNRGTVFLYRPSANKIIWLQTGPWLNQHDARFIDDHSISVFGNDMVRVFGEEKLLNGHNEEYIFNFATGKTTTPFAGFFKSAGIATENEGLARVLPNGDLFAEETNKNRSLRGSANKVIWQYVDRINDHALASLSLSGYITPEEFSKLTFLKGKQ